MIEKKIHQIFMDFGAGKKLEDNTVFLMSVNSIKDLMPDYEHKIWSEDDIVKLIGEEMPDLLSFYNELRYKIQKVDMGRYIILYLEGGFYLDLDIIALKRFDDFLIQNIIFYKDRLGINDRKKKNEQTIGMDFLASPKGYKLWNIVLKDLVINYRKKEKMSIYDVWKGRFVLQTTGPYFINRLLKEKGIKIKTQDIMCWSKETELNEDNYYIKNYLTGSWLGTEGIPKDNFNKWKKDKKLK